MSSITLKDFENTFAGVYCTGFFIGTTVILLLVFVPKVCIGGVGIWLGLELGLGPGLGLGLGL